MEPMALVVLGAGLSVFLWVMIGPNRRRKKLGDRAGRDTDGKIVNLTEWMHDGHRRCQVEYQYEVSDPGSGEAKTLSGKSNCIPDIYDRLKVDNPIKIRYLPKSPEFSRPIFDK